MKRFLSFLFCLILLVGCNPQDDPTPDPIVKPEVYDGFSGITYQLLVYSFCDSDGDGIGDFNGIASKLDYLKEMGVQALWLSPIHKATSYHGYDVEDYDSVNPEYGTEADFKNLVEKAHSKGIRIYLDYVLNHTSKEHPWFLEGKSDPDSKYRDFYYFSTTQKSGYSSAVSGSVPKNINIKFTLKCTGGTPQTLKAEKVESDANEGQPGSGKYLWYGTVTEGTMPEFYSAGNDTYTLTIKNFESTWGVLVRTSKTEWGNKKFGASSTSAQTLVWGVPLTLKANSDYDILMPWMGQIWYQSVFGSYMPDLNYGPAATCETSEAFKAVTASADKWIKLGVDGFRLDAVKHIYDNAHSDENPTFLKKFYDHCNATYKARGGEGDIYMVGEMWEDPRYVAPYYKGLPAYFEFAFWDRFKEALNSGNGNGFVSTIQSYRSLYKQFREDFIAATKLTNHDQDRAANDLQKNEDKLKLAAAVLLTFGGEPYIYQGEELGYWGSKGNGDEYVRTPMMWTKSGSPASKKLGGKVDNSMLKPEISVEAQTADANSLLNVYRQLGKARAKTASLAVGAIGTSSNISAPVSVAAWTRTAGDETVLCLHNFSGENATVTIAAEANKGILFQNGIVTSSGSKIILGPYSSAVVMQ